MDWKYVKPLRDDLSVSQFEAEFGAVLPPALRQIVLLHNAGTPSRDRFTLPDGEKDRVKGLLSFNREDKGNVWQVNAVEGRPQGLVAFAQDPFGSDICVKTDTGEVFFVDNDTGEVYNIAPDVEFFLSSLGSAP